MSSQSEAKLIAHVKEALKGHKGLEGDNIFISVKGKVVTLKGVVDTPKEHKKAFEVAREVSGVDSVINELQVMNKIKSDAEMADMQQAKSPAKAKKPQAKPAGAARAEKKSVGGTGSSGRGSAQRSQGLSMEGAGLNGSRRKTAGKNL